MDDLVKSIGSFILAAIMVFCPIGATLGFMYGLAPIAALFATATIFEFGGLYALIKERAN